MTRTRHITLPVGFSAAGVACGIKHSGKEDLAVFAADQDAAAAIVTTRNQIVGAPVTLCRQRLPRGYGRVRAVVINSGSSNVCTGAAGLKDAQAMAAATAKQLGTTAEKVLVASTGIIGHRLPMKKVRAGIAEACASLGRRDDSPAVRAIMTTDLREKSAVVQVRVGGELVTVAGVAKGSGMIAPSMATMLAVIHTDAAVAPHLLHRMLRDATNDSFNAITIDTDTSTSDTVFALASGASGAAKVKSGQTGAHRLAGALKEVCGELARAIVADGEGATKVITVTVSGAKSAAEADLAARAVADSPLFKCAMHGADPNWGRIVMALGKSAATVHAETLKVKIGPTTVFSGGTGRKFDTAQVAEYLAGPTIEVRCDLGVGKAQRSMLTCDLSREYIAINAEYHT